MYINAVLATEAQKAATLEKIVILLPKLYYNWENGFIVLYGIPSVLYENIIHEIFSNA